MTAWYEQSFSREYLALYPHRDREEAVRDVDRILALLGPSLREPILDLGCGAGRHLIALWAAGYRNLAGLDLSHDLLAEARARFSKEDISGIELVEADMRRLPYSAHFSTVLSLFTSFGYFADPEDDRHVLCAVHRALRPGGRFLIDTLGRTATIASLVREEEKVIGTRRLHIRRTLSEDGDRVEKETHVVDSAGQRTYHESVRLYSARALTEDLQCAGFAHVACYGSLDGDPYVENSARLVAIADKAAS